jgi:4'-phosphopantetheinyl transferase
MTIDVYRIRIAGPSRSGCVDAALHAILTARLGAPPRLIKGAHGKPGVAGAGVEFNVAHSGALALIAVRAGGPLGVDVEQHRAMPDAALLAARFFTVAEASAVAVAPSPDHFFRIWTRKEAWAKAQGLGLYAPLDAVDVSGHVDGWFIADLDLGAGYCAAVACPGPPVPVRMIDG